MRVHDRTDRKIDEERHSGRRGMKREITAFLLRDLSDSLDSIDRFFAREKGDEEEMETLRQMSIDSSGSNRVLARFPTSV